MMEKLWGDNFFDPATKKWTNKVRCCAKHVAAVVLGFEKDTWTCS